MVGMPVNVHKDGKGLNLIMYIQQFKKLGGKKLEMDC
jgi:hypothetical protein